MISVVERRQVSHKKHIGSSYIITLPNLHVVRSVNCPNLDPCLSGLILVYRLWGDESMQKAIAAVEQGGASICHAAEKYGIPRSTLSIYSLLTTTYWYVQTKFILV